MSSSDKLTITNRKTYLTTANPFEQKFGYHRAVRRGPFITTSGTTALKLVPSSSSIVSGKASTGEVVSESDPESSKVHCPGDVHGQTIHVLEICIAAVGRLGGKKEDIIRVRMFVANSNDCGIVGSAFKEVFGSQNEGNSEVSGQNEDVVGTTATMIVVPGGFVDGDILVEIEIDAFVV